MALFKRLFLCALLVGLVAGLAQSVVQRWRVVPIIEAAEVFESQGEGAAAAHPHDSAAQGHEHHADAWAPKDGLERTFWTAVANVLTGIGFALLLIPAIAWWDHRRGGSTAPLKTGLLWGAAGWFCLFAWPSLGLHPGIPGEASSALALRQGWWLLAAACAAGGLATLVLARGAVRFVGLPLLALPFIVGAPIHDGPEFAASSVEAAAQLAILKSDFMVATAVASAIHWLVLGALSSLVFARWLRPLMDGTPRELPPGVPRAAREG